MLRRTRRSLAIVLVVSVTWVLFPILPAQAGMTCFGWTPTIVGTRGDDVIRGTSGDDVIVGLAGDDEINGRGGDDLICGYKGADLVLGGGGADVVSGSEGDDDVRGGGGADWVLGLDGNDALSGGDGFDYGSWFFADGPVSVDLAAGTASGEGNDELSTIEGIEGSPFADTLVGDQRNNEFLPGDGDDTVDGAGGIGDLVDYFFSDGPVVVDLLAGTATGEGSDALVGIEDVFGSDSSDTITGDAASNFLSGGRGDDEISGGDGDDFLFGDKGDDTLDGGPGTDELDGGAGSDACANGEDLADCET